MPRTEKQPGSLIHSRLAGLRGQRLLNDIPAILLLVIGLLAVGITAVTMLFWSGWVLLVLAPPVGYVAWRWLAGLSTRQLAYAVEARYSAVAGRLVAALDLSGRVEQRQGYSPELREAAVRAVEAEFRTLPLGRLCDRRRVLLGLVVALLGIGPLQVTRTAFPERFGIGLVNAFARDRLGVEFIVQPGDTAVLPGAEFELTCRVEPAGVFSRVVLEQSGARVKHLPLEDGVAKLPIHASRDGCSSSGREPFSAQRYRFRILGAVSEEYRIRLLEPLRIEELSYTAEYPDYSGLPDSRETGPNLVALVGSRFGIKGRASRELAEARLSFSSDTVMLEPGVDGAFTGGFSVKGSDRGTIELRDDDAGGFQECGFLTVRALPDEVPLVRIVRPGKDVDLPMSMQLPLLINSLDDYGLGVLFLNWGRDDSLGNRLRIKSLAGRREDTTLYTWDLSDVGLLPGDVIRYRAEVTDNDVVSGPKTGRSEVFEVRFPTMMEIYSASVRQAEHTRTELQPMRELQERLTDEVGRLGEQARSAGDLSWDERQALGELLSEQKDLADEMSGLHQQVQDLLDDIYDGVAFDEETVRRLSELSQLLSELLPRDLAESLERLREELGESSPEMRAALEQFQMDQEEFRQQLDAALEFLKQVMEEQRLEALARTAEELARLETDIAERALSEAAGELVRQQEALAGQLDELLADIAELAAQMSDTGTAEGLDELAEAAEQDKLSDMAHEAAASFGQDQARTGQQQSAQVARKLDQLARSLSGLSSDLKQKRSADVARKMAGAAEELLLLSREQQSLVDELAPGMESGPPIARGMAIHDATGVVAESLAALSSRTMAVPGRSVGELGQARQLMRNAGQDLLENRTGRAAGQGLQARAALDRAAAGLLEALAQAEQAGGMAGGFESLMEALSQLAAGQMAINVGMGGMPMPLPGDMGQGLAEALGRMLAQQGALREKLEQLLEEMGGQRPGLTSALDAMVEEMKEVERDMTELRIDRELIERQEGILSRLLDAQRSIRQRGFKEEREGETAGEFEREPVPALPEDRGERNRLLREELLRALREGRLGRFEAQVRAYFERLLHEE